MSDFSIRLARAEDAEALPEIELAAGKVFETVAGLAGVAGMHAIPADEQRRIIRKGHSLVAEADGRVVGFISTEPFRRELHIREFSVHPDYQGRGIGGVLLRAVAIDARNSGFAALTLTTFADVPWNGLFYAPTRVRNRYRPRCSPAPQGRHRTGGATRPAARTAYRNDKVPRLTNCGNRLISGALMTQCCHKGDTA